MSDSDLSTERETGLADQDEEEQGEPEGDSTKEDFTTPRPNQGDEPS